MATEVAAAPPGGAGEEEDPLTRIEPVPLAKLVRDSLKRTYEMFLGNALQRVPDDPKAMERKLKIKYQDEYKHVRDVSAGDKARAGGENVISVGPGAEPEGPAGPRQPSTMAKMLENIGPSEAPSSSTALSILGNAGQPAPATPGNAMGGGAARNSTVLAVKNMVKIPKPVWNPPWKLMRVISGHEGWVRCIAVDPTNEWFASGSQDRLIKIWDLATGTLKLSLTGHVSTIRGLAISDRHPYLFSASEDNEVKCWDLEQNMVIRQYHGHLSGVYSLALHPTLNILASGGRDSVVRVWDMRTKEAIFVLGGHTNAVCSLVSQAAEPQFISGSMDHMVRLWDLAAGKCAVTLTNHKKSIRALSIHPNEYTFASCAADNNKIWRCPRGVFERNVGGHHAIVNCSAIKSEGDRSILTCGTDDGFLHFWDWRSGHKFQTIEGIPQPGSLSAENGIFAMSFDMSQTRLITGECDKTIKFYKEDPDATEETHPLNWRPPKMQDRSRF